MVTNKAGARLPRTASPPSRAAELVRGLVALVGTVAIVAGVPIVLVAAFGVPWPTHAPDSSWVTAPITSGTLLGVLAAVVWLGWLHLVVCLVVELVADRRARGLAPHVPGGAIGTQLLARRLVATMALLAGSATLSVSTAAAVTAPAGHDHVAPARTVEAPRMEVARESPASVGDRSRATAGDVAAQRRGEVTYYDVKPPSGRNYDTLWDIAERYLGDGLRYKEIYDLNRGVTQPDGRVLASADLIHPGWVMQMPADAKGPGLKVIDHVGTPDQHRTPPVRTDAEPSAGQASSSSTTTTTTTSRADAVPTDRANDVPDWAPMYGVAGGLAIAGAALGVRRARAAMPTGALWAALNERRDPDPSGPDPSDDPTPSPGAALRDEADIATATWIDRALRSWNDDQGPVPTTSRCTMTSDGLAVAFGTAAQRAAPTGWSASSDARVWTIDRETHTSVRGLSPLPGLVTVGRRDDDSVLLLDLESIPGLISLGGDPTAARAVAMSMAVDTATHPWADECTVTLVGFADDLSPVGRGNIRAVADIEQVLDSLGNIARHQRNACRRADTVSLRTARGTRPDDAAWRYELVVCSGVPAAETVSALSDLAADQQVSLAVVIVGDCPEAAARFAVSGGGRLTAGFLGVDVRSQQLSVAASRSIVDLSDVPDAQEHADLDTLAAALAAEIDQAGTSGEEPRVRVDVLGPIEIRADGPLEEDRRDLLTEIAVYLALHPGGVHVNRLTGAIWPRGVDPSTRDAALDALTAWLSTDGHTVVRERAGVWVVDPQSVAVDWHEFRAALNRAAQEPSERRTILRGALALVRGPAFADVPDGRYGWLGGDPVEDDMILAVGLTARTVAQAAAARDDDATARDALIRGLALLPASEELWCAAIRLADRFGGTRDAELVAGQMYAAIERHGSPLGASAQTDALVDEILPGYRARAA